MTTYLTSGISEILFLLCWLCCSLRESFFHWQKLHPTNITFYITFMNKASHPTKLLPDLFLIAATLPPPPSFYMAGFINPSKEGLIGFKPDLKLCKTQWSLLSAEAQISIFFALLWKNSLKIWRRLNQHNFLLHISSNSDRSYTIQHSYLNNKCPTC